MQKATAIAVQKVIAAGARPETVTITEKESLPLQYVDHQVRTVVKAVGDFSPSKIIVDESIEEEEEEERVTNGYIQSKQAQEVEQHVDEQIDISKYRPEIVADKKMGVKTWIVSTTDLEWLAEGCYVLGCGGGGSPYPEMLKLRQHVREGHKLRIIDMDSLKPDARIYCKNIETHPANLRLTLHRGW